LFPSKTYITDPFQKFPLKLSIARFFVGPVFELLYPFRIAFGLPSKPSLREKHVPEQ
jgi:hypothetical protein